METSDTLKLSTIISGEVGHPALLVHDLFASLHDWESLIPELVESGHVTYACDLFGHGQSPQPVDPALYYPQMHMAAFRGWIDSLELTRSPILIGHGFGAYLCLRYALGHPYKVFRLVLINPLLSPAQVWPFARLLEQRVWLAGLAARLAPRWSERQLLGLQRGLDPALEQTILSRACQASPHNRGILTRIVDLSPDLPGLPTRCLLLWGQQDELLDMSELSELVEDLPDMRCAALPGLGHRPHLEAPAETNKLIVNFLHGI